MPRRAVKAESTDVRGEDLLVSTLPQLLQKKLLHLVPHNRPVRGPHDQPLAYLIIDQEQIQLLTQLAMIALESLLLCLQTGLKLLLARESCPVDPLQHLVFLIPAMVSTCQPQQLERLNLPRALYVGAGT